MVEEQPPMNWFTAVGFTENERGDRGIVKVGFSTEFGALDKGKVQNALYVWAHFQGNPELTDDSSEGRERTAQLILEAENAIL